MREYNFYELQSKSSDSQWRRFRQSKNDISLAEAQEWAKEQIKQANDYNRHLSAFISLSFPENWRLVKVKKQMEDVPLS